jgi:hypothetical protein
MKSNKTVMIITGALAIGVVVAQLLKKKGTPPPNFLVPNIDPVASKATALPKDLSVYADLTPTFKAMPATEPIREPVVYTQPSGGSIDESVLMPTTTRTSITLNTFRTLDYV